MDKIFDAIYYIGVSAGTVFIIFGLLIMVVTKFIMKIAPDKNQKLFKRINTIGYILINVSLILILASAFFAFC